MAGPLPIPAPEEPEISPAGIAADVLCECQGDVRALIEEGARRAAIATRREASRRVLSAATLRQAWDAVMAIAVG